MSLFTCNRRLCPDKRHGNKLNIAAADYKCHYLHPQPSRLWPWESNINRRLMFYFCLLENVYSLYLFILNSAQCSFCTISQTQKAQYHHLWKAHITWCFGEDINREISSIYQHKLIKKSATFLMSIIVPSIRVSESQL